MKSLFDSDFDDEFHLSQLGDGRFDSEVEFFNGTSCDSDFDDEFQLSQLGDDSFDSEVDSDEVEAFTAPVAPNTPPMPNAVNIAAVDSAGGLK